MTDLIERLRDKTVSLGTCDEAADALEAAVRVIAPFAERASRYDNTKVSTITDGAELWQLEGNVGWRVDLTVGHLRAARDWLARHATQRQGGSMAEVVMARSPRAQALLEEIDRRKRQGGDDDSL